MRLLDSLSLRSTCLAAFVLTPLTIFAPAVQAESWQVAVGAQSNNKGRQALAFLPNEIWIHAGDSITWKVSTDEIHTVTFLKDGAVRLPFTAGCPGTTPDGSAFDGSACVNAGPMVNGQSYTVTFPQAGNFKLSCLVHPNMTATVHVLSLSENLPHDQRWYDDQARNERKDLLLDSDVSYGHDHSQGNRVMAGIGEAAATGGGSQTLSVMRFTDSDKEIHVGETVEWTNSDPVTPHTITFGVEPSNPVPPSDNVTQDADGALHGVMSSTSDSVHSGFIVAAAQDRIGLPQSPVGVTRFRVTFTHAGTYHYICALHDGLGMKGKVLVR